jgi:hypothetical protein
VFIIPLDNNYISVENLCIINIRGIGYFHFIIISAAVTKATAYTARTAVAEQ